MKRCPITYETIGDDERYSQSGLKLLSRRLTDLAPLPFTAQELRQEAGARADKMSIQKFQTVLVTGLCAVFASLVFISSSLAQYIKIILAKF